VWYGILWCGVVFCGVVWYGVVWYQLLLGMQMAGTRAQTLPGPGPNSLLITHYYSLLTITHYLLLLESNQIVITHYFFVNYRVITQ
jgi:hypothetical protein